MDSREEAVKQLCYNFLEGVGTSGVLAIGLGEGERTIMAILDHRAEENLKDQMQESLRGLGETFRGMELQTVHSARFRVDLGGQVERSDLISAPEGIPRPGDEIREHNSNRKGALGCFLKIGAKLHLLTAEHVLVTVEQDGEPIVEARYQGWYKCGAATPLNSNLFSATPSEVGDFEVSEVSVDEVLKQPECHAVEISGVAVPAATLLQLVGRRVHACKRGTRRGGEIIAVGMCAKVGYAKGTEWHERIFHDQIIVKSQTNPPIRKFRPGDSGSLVVLAPAPGVEIGKAGDAVGLFYANSGHLACLAPMHRIMTDLETEPQQAVEIDVT